jgi:hypothetical protein
MYVCMYVYTYVIDRFVLCRRNQNHDEKIVSNRGYVCVYMYCMYVFYVYMYVIHEATRPTYI